MPYSWGIESKSRVLEVRPMAANQPRLIRGKGIASRRFCKINMFAAVGRSLQSTTLVRPEACQQRENNALPPSEIRLVTC